MTDNFKILPVEFQSYVNQLSQKLTVIRAEVAANALKECELMTQKEHKRTNPLNLNVGDYVYMLTEPTDKRRKLQSK